MSSEDIIRQLRTRLHAETRAREEAVVGRQQAEAGRQQAEAGRQQAEDRLRATTFHEHLAAYRRHIPQPVVQRDKSLSTTGTTTSPQGKKRPTYMRQWTTFLSEQSHITGLTQRIIHADARDFSSEAYIEGTAARLQELVIGSEKDLERYLYDAVEKPVMHVIGVLQRSHVSSPGLRLGSNFAFKNQLSKLAESQGSGQPSSLSTTPSPPTRPRVDQVCVVAGESDQALPRTVLVAEYKAPHKMTPSHLRAGLREMDIREVINRADLPLKENDSEVFAYNADKLVASAVTQTYDYMARCGLRYGYLTTGEAYVFLMVDWNEPEVVHFHLAEPASEVAAQPSESALYCTAVSQVLAFCLLAIQTAPLPQEQHNDVLSRLPEWAVDWESILEQVHTSSPDRQLSSSSFEEPAAYADVDRSPRVTRQKAGRCESEDDPLHRSPSRTPSPDSPPPRPGRQQSKRNRSETASASPQQSRQEKRPATSRPRESEFCTHTCIQSLVQGDVPDKKCPNFQQHFYRASLDPKHPFSATSLVEAIRRQQSQTLDEGCKPIDRGSRSIVFKITLLTHGYTLIGKGTVDALQGRLKIEQRAYKWLRSLQGISIPVCLGLVQMPCTYYFDLDQITHMLLMTWAGYKTTPDDGEKAEMRMILRNRGIVRWDTHNSNFRRCPYSDRLIAIDFEESKFIKLPQPAAINRLKRARNKQGETLPLKRQRRSV